MSVQLTINLPEDAFSILRTHPDSFIKEMRLAAAIKWFEIGQIFLSFPNSRLGMPVITRNKMMIKDKHGFPPCLLCACYKW